MIPCKVLIEFEGNLPGSIVHLSAIVADRLASKGFVTIEIDLVGDRIVEMAEKEKEMLRELIKLSPDDLQRQVYKRRLTKLEKGDLRP